MSKGLLRSAPWAVGIALIIGLYVGNAYAWQISVDFEGGSVGAQALGSSAFNEAGTLTTISSEMARSGSKSAKLVFHAGSTGYNEAAGVVRFPQAVGVGGELWVRGYFYLGYPWTWKAASTGNCGCEIKTARTHTQDGGGGHRGYVGIATNDWGFPFVLCETCNNLQGYAFRQQAVVLEPGRWYSLEVYTKFHPTDGIVRMWIDGQLRVQGAGLQTAYAYGDVMDYTQFMGYWNGGCAGDQVMYLDDLVMSTDFPAGRDAAGNAMIGSASVPGGGGTPAGDQSVPAPPTNLRVQ